MTIERFRALLGDDGVIEDALDQAPYLSDWWGRRTGQALCTLLPREAGQVAALLAICREAGIAVYPQGGNTSVCGGAVPPPAGPGEGGGESRGEGRAVVVNLARMARILDLNPADNSITVQAGCILAHVQEAAAAAGRLFPLSLGAEGSCQIGGNLSTNAGGTAVLRYGNARDLVLGLEVALPDGRLWNGLRTLRKNNTGYDLKNLFIGAEGSLGIITAASLKLFPLPSRTVTAFAGLAETAQAVALGQRLQDEFPGELTALELISESELGLVLKHVPETRSPLARPCPWYLLAEIASSAATAALPERLEAVLAQALAEEAVADAVVAQSEAQRRRLWQLRHSVTEANRAEGIGVSLDIAVPVWAVPRFIERADAAIARDFPEGRVVVVGHIGDGNIHYIIMHDRGFWSGLADPAAYHIRIARTVYDVAIGLAGTFSAEHGIGSLHRDEMARYKDPVELALMAEVKHLLDPAGIMNPGRVLP